jgi:site-specific DNA recombinase
MDGHLLCKGHDEWDVVAGMREPLVAPDAFDLVQEAIASRERASRNLNEPESYLLTGLVRCGACGGPMCGKTRRKGGRTYRYYVCNRGCSGGPGGRRSRSVPAEQFEGAVGSILVGLAARCAVRAARRP